MLPGYRRDSSVYPPGVAAGQRRVCAGRFCYPCVDRNGGGRFEIFKLYALVRRAILSTVLPLIHVDTTAKSRPHGAATAPRRHQAWNYYYRYIAATYGQYTGMGTSMLAGGLYQALQYVTLGVNTPFQTATPTFSPGTGTYSTAQSVSIADATSGAVIYYTTDGSTPNTSSSVYHSAITVTATTTVNALAVAPGYTNSAVSSATYTFNPYLGTNAYSTLGER